jgi:hypothetical protein
MAFQYTDRHREEYVTDGLTILRGVIPTSLLAGLRRETDTAREIARARHGPQAQRLQPVYAYDQLNHQLFRDFLDLPGLQEAVRGILGPDRHQSNIMGVLFEPAEIAWTTGWHRDLPDGTTEGVGMESIANLRLYNQFNAALYDDHSFWVVPGSHDRDDTAEERAAHAARPPGRDTPMDPTEREVACLAHVRAMRGATQIVLCAGDVAFYRASAWHLGNYVPYVKRATLHDVFYCDEDPYRERYARPVTASAT